MNRRLVSILASLAVGLAGSLVASAATAADVGVSVSIGQPGFYGRIDVGSFPPPAVIYPQPVIISPAPIAAVQQPIYLRVPPGHAKNWSRHCSRYNACGQRTYFVQDSWYQSVYAPAYIGRHQDVHYHRAPRHHHQDERHGGHGEHRGRGRH